MYTYKPIAFSYDQPYWLNFASYGPMCMYTEINIAMHSTIYMQMKL